MQPSIFERIGDLSPVTDDLGAGSPRGVVLDRVVVVDDHNPVEKRR